MKILVIDDEPAIIETVVVAFEISWQEVEVVKAGSGNKGLVLAETESPDVVILDLGLPDKSGFDVLKEIRLFSDVPVLVLTVRGEETSIVRALSLGANDYLTKPFRHLELVARVRALTRRRQTREPGKELTIGEWSLDNSYTEFKSKNSIIHLTFTEGMILAILIEHTGKFVSNETLAKDIWQRKYPEIADSLRVHIRHLRMKIDTKQKESVKIFNKPRFGYMLLPSK